MTSPAILPVSTDPALQLWYALQTRYRFEKKVAAQLEEKRLPVFLPLRKESRCWGDRKKEILVPVFPGVVFVRTDRSVFHRLIILQMAGVLGFVSSAGAVAAISQKKIEDLQLLLEKEISFSTQPVVKAGKHVRIRGGTLDRVEGLLTRRGKRRLLISFDALQRALAIDLQGYEVERI